MPGLSITGDPQEGPFAQCLARRREAKNPHTARIRKWAEPSIARTGPDTPTGLRRRRSL
jgi:hypothetical protein